MSPTSTPDSARPAELTQVGRQALCVRWADGHESAYPFRLLRRLCACAACRSAAPPPEPKPGNPFRVLGPEPSAEPVRLERVGHYAVGVNWKDGHHSIFAFESLRRDCPCPECAEGRAKADEELKQRLS